MVLLRSLLRPTIFQTTSAIRAYSIISSNVTEIKSSPSPLNERSQASHQAAAFNQQSTIELLKSYMKVFPDDPKTQTHDKIDLLIDGIVSQSPIRVGLIYDNSYKQSSSKFLETLLADPLASDNSWFNSVKKRDNHVNNLFKYSLRFNMNDMRTEEYDKLYEIPAPVLDKDERNLTDELAVAVEPRNIELLEINDLKKVEHTKNCHFYLYLTSNSTLTYGKVSELDQYKPIFTVIDNEEYSPKSNESTRIDYGKTDIVKINSKLLYEGINKISEDPINGLSYFDSLQNSNIFQVIKIMNYYSDISKLSPLIIRSIISASEGFMEKEENNKQHYLSKDEEIKKLILKFSELSHYDLQFKFKPLIKKFFHENLNWFKLYYKNDNIEYDLSFFLQLNYMQNSIENYNFINGKISNITNSNLEAKEYIRNPIIELRNKTIDELSSLQNEIIKLLSFNFITYQFPLCLLSICGYIFYLININTVISLSLLGIIIGFNNVSKNWIKIYNDWETKLIDDIRFNIKISELNLNEEWESELNKKIKLINDRNSVLDKLK